jgi:hypothetical protein
MTFSKAKNEFDIRYYLWALSEFHREIDQSFENLRLFKVGAGRDILEIMDRLDRPRQRTLAHALLKRFHPNAVAALGQKASAEELALRALRDSFREIRRAYGFMLQLEAANQPDLARFWLNQIDRVSLQILSGEAPIDETSVGSQIKSVLGTTPPGFEDEIDLRRKRGEKLKLIGKRKLLKITAERFQKAFNGLCIETLREETIDPTLAFAMKVDGWVLKTSFWFGRNSTVLNYAHLITSDTVFDYNSSECEDAPPFILGSMISFNSYLGISSQTEWRYITEDDIEPIFAVLISLCRHFFDAVPTLLKGLQCDDLPFTGVQKK